jgi:catechol 2,3-dioxygenase-like lactoylglutathione lyase family enzyme
MNVSGIHHVAYRCRDAKETVLWYQKMLKMDFVLAMAEDEVPSTKENYPYMHIFLDAGRGNVLAFFELPTQKSMGVDENTPAWVQHIAFQVDDLEQLMSFKSHLESHGLDVVGVTDHGIMESIYFRDPSGHRLELTCPLSDGGAQLKRLNDVKWDMLEEWSKTKQPPRHAAFLHAKN